MQQGAHFSSLRGGGCEEPNRQSALRRIFKGNHHTLLHLG